MWEQIVDAKFKLQMLQNFYIVQLILSSLFNSLSSFFFSLFAIIKIFVLNIFVLLICTTKFGLSAAVFD